MAIRQPPPFDPKALISSIQMHGVPVAEIARETGLCRAHIIGWPTTCRLSPGSLTRRSSPPFPSSFPRAANARWWCNPRVRVRTLLLASVGCLVPPRNSEAVA
jgi:hypothetical protein